MSQFNQKDIEFYKEAYDQFSKTIGFTDYLSTYGINFNVIIHIDKDIYNEINRELVLNIIDITKIVFNKYGINMHIVNIKDVDFDKSEVNSLLDVPNIYQSQLTSNPLNNKNFNGVLILLTTKEHNTNINDPVGLQSYYGNMKSFITINLKVNNLYQPIQIKESEYIYTYASCLLHELGHYLGASHDDTNYDIGKSIMYHQLRTIKTINELFFSPKSINEFIQKTSIETYYDNFKYTLTVNNEYITKAYISNKSDFIFKIDKGTIEDIIVYFQPYGDGGSIIEYLNKNNIQYELTHDTLKYSIYQKETQLKGWYAYVARINDNGEIVYTNPVIIILE